MDAIEIIYIVGFVIFTGVRKYYTGKFKPGHEQEKKGSLVDKVLLGFIGISMILPLVKIWIDLFPFANYKPISILQWLGLFVFILGIYILYRSHVDLGKNWNPQVAINQKQVLVQNGIYRKIRHPMYTAHLLWGIGNALVFANWIIGPVMLLGIVLFLPQRIRREEKLLIQEFGDEYEQYKANTGAMVFKL